MIKVNDIIDIESVKEVINEFRKEIYACECYFEKAEEASKNAMTAYNKLSKLLREGENKKDEILTDKIKELNE